MEKKVRIGGRQKGTPNKKSLNFTEGLAGRGLNFLDEFIKVYLASDLEGKRTMLLKSCDYIFPKLKSMEIKTDQDQDAVFNFNIIKVDGQNN